MISFGLFLLFGRRLLSPTRLAMSMVVLLSIVPSFSSASSRYFDQGTVSYTVTYLEDKSNELTLDDMFLSPWRYNFQKLDHRTNFGVSTSGLWFKLSIPAQVEVSDAILEVGYPLLDKVTVYAQERGEWVETIMGDSLPFSQRNTQHVNFLKKVNIQLTMPQIIYVKVENEGPLNVTIRLWDDVAFYYQDRTRMVITGSFFGAMLAIMIFNYFIYLSVGDRSYLYYVGYLLFLSLFTFCLHGFMSAYVLPESPGVVNRMIYPFLYLAMILGLKFSGEVNSMATLSPDVLRVINQACIALFGVGLLGSFLGNRYLALITPYIGIFVIGLFIYVIIEGIRAKYRPSYFVGAAFLAIAPGGVLFALGTMGLIKGGAWTSTAFQAGVVAEALLLSFALAYRIRYTERKLVEAREIVGQTRVAFARQHIESRDEERKYLAGELHDGLGQNLLVIKNKINRVIDSCMQGDKNLEEAQNIVQITIDDVRRLSHQLHPHILDRLGLKEAASAVVRDAFDPKEVRVKCLIDDTEVLRKGPVALHLFRIVQEAVKNILTHAKPKFVNVEMFQLADTIILRIENLSDTFDLAWMPATSLKHGLGLNSIMERVELLNGECVLLHSRSGGFRIEVTVPFER